MDAELHLPASQVAEMDSAENIIEWFSWWEEKNYLAL